MLWDAEEAKLGNGKEALFQKLIRSNKVRVKKLFGKPSTWHNGRVDTTKIPRTTNISSLLSTLESPLASQQSQIQPFCRGRLVHTPKRVIESVDRERELGHVLYGGGGNFEQYPEGGTTIVAHEGDPTKSEYLTFDPGGISTIKCSPTGGQVSEYSRYPRGNPS